MSTERDAARPMVAEATFRVPKTPTEAAVRVTVRIDPDRRLTASMPGEEGDLVEQGEFLAALGATPAWWPYLRMALTGLAQDPTLSPEDVFWHLRTSPSRRAAQAARVGRLGVGRVWMFALDPVSHVRYTLAEAFPEGGEFEPVAVALLDDTERARNLTLARVTWSRLLDRAAATHPDGLVRAAFVRRHAKRVPEDLHEALAEDPAEDVRRLLASSVKVTASLVERLAADPMDSVRRAVAREQHLTERAAQTLTAEPNYPGGIWAVLANRTCPRSVWERFLDIDEVTAFWRQSQFGFADPRDLADTARETCARAREAQDRERTRRVPFPSPDRRRD